jgi:Ca2+-transporting ATPase
VVDEALNLDPAHGPISPAPPALLKTLLIGGICNKARRGEDGNGGQATDVALLNVLSVHELGDPRPDFKVIIDRPFSSEKKYMAVSGIHTSYGSDGREYYYLKGSIEAVLARCRFYYVSDESTPGLDANTRAIILSRAEKVASQGLRVVAMAYGVGGAEMHESDGDEPRQTLVFTGFQAMLDPPRQGVADAISLLHSGGVQVIMITGDAEHTALSIARQLGLRIQAGTSSCITGRDIDAMSERALQERIGSVSVFARTTPRHKMRIIEALQARGAIVAMTGDGVNDAPALKMANIGISMGKSGTDVAKEAADVILVDDNFSTILSAVEEGKSIFHNIQNFLSFQLSTAVAALTLITLSTVFRLSNPLNPMQILFINILMDGPPSQSLGVDPVDRAVMKRPPRPKDAPIITRRLLQRVLFSAAMIVFGTLFVYIYELSDGRMSRRDQTMTFTSFVFLDLASALQNRGLGCGLFDNKMLITTVSVSFIVQLSLIYVPFMQTIFQTEALAKGDLITLLLLAATSMTLHEFRRRYERQLDSETFHSSAAEELA